MKRFIISILLVTIFVSLFDYKLWQSSDEREMDNNYIEKQTKFILVSSTEKKPEYGYHIMVDKETGVEYILYHDFSRFGMSVRLNTDGTPMIYEGELD